jgi:GntR family transcriptional regulator/MocR family aminotransferase
MSHKIIINFDVFSPVALYQQFATELRGIIRSGVIRPGEKLPSIRELAKQLQVSTITVREGLDRLAQDGVIQARQGSGNYVSQNQTNAAATIQPSIQSSTSEIVFTQAAFQARIEELDPGVKWSAEAKRLNHSFNHSSFHPWWDEPAQYDFRVYQPAEKTVAGLHWERALGNWARHFIIPGEQTRDPRGLSDLREHLAGWLNKTIALECRADDLMIVSGAQQARDLVSRLLVERGRQVIFEEPGSITDSLAYTSKGAELVLAPHDAEGIDVCFLKSYRQATAAHIISTANFPSGITMSTERRMQLLRWASDNQVVIVEDGYGSGFVHQSPVAPTLHKLARTMEKPPAVIYLGSLSQLLNPGLRLGYVVLPEWLQNSFALTRWLADRHNSIVPQQIALKIIADGGFEEDCMRVTQAARARRKVMLQELNRWPQHLVEWSPVTAGLQQPVWFKNGLDDLIVFEQALREGIGVIPLSPYHRTESVRHGLSLSFFQMDAGKIVEGMRKLAEVIMAVAPEPVH